MIIRLAEWAGRVVAWLMNTRDVYLPMTPERRRMLIQAERERLNELLEELIK